MDLLTSLRHILHIHPELSGEEQKTASTIKQFLSKHDPDFLIDSIGGHGIIAGYQFSCSGPTIMIRCELDALPIDESLHFDHASEIQGISHKCGHDGHMTMVAGLAPWLSYQKFKQGSVYLLFQPAEETGKGARAVLKDPKFKNLTPDYVFALHNLPGYPMHEITLVENQFNATVLSLGISLEGKTCHASEPEKGLNPSMAIATLTTQILKLAVRDTALKTYALITPVHTLIGSKDYGISPGSGEVHFTLRTWNEETMESIVQAIKKIVDKECKSQGFSYHIDSCDYFPSVINNPTCNHIIEVCADIAGLRVKKETLPIRFGEDFGFITQQFNGAMFGLGAGIDTPPLHSSSYDFPDELIGSGIKMFQSIITYILSDNKDYYAIH